MYKKTQDRADYRGRVGSHATKGSATRGVLTPTKSFEMTPTRVSAFLDEVGAERALLASKKKDLEGLPPSPQRTKSMIALDARLSLLNEKLAFESRKLWDSDLASCLREAVKAKVQKHVADSIFDLAQEMYEQRKKGLGEIG